MANRPVVGAMPGVFARDAVEAMRLAALLLFLANRYVLLDGFSSMGVGTTSNPARYCNPTVDRQLDLTNATADASARQSVLGASIARGK